MPATEAGDLRERLLAVMDGKDHPTWHRLAGGELRKPQLLIHYQQEWETYVRDFPVLLARVLGKAPPPSVRRMLAENLYEEQTGGFSLGRPHAELFLETMEAAGFARGRFAEVALLPEAAAYRAFLEHVTLDRPWQQAAALVTIFVEGSRHDRAELAGAADVGGGAADVEAQVRAHPLVRHYGVAPERLTIVRAHRQVEGGHRRDAWAMVLDHVAAPAQADAVADVLRTALALWRLYRDGVGRAMDAAR